MILEKDALWQLIGLHAVCWNKRRASILNEGNRGAIFALKPIHGEDGVDVNP